MINQNLIFFEEFVEKSDFQIKLSPRLSSHDLTTKSDYFQPLITKSDLDITQL